LVQNVIEFVHRIGLNDRIIRRPLRVFPARRILVASRSDAS
jgi:hypothetical protein